jgi:hypothetical protein
MCPYVLFALALIVILAPTLVRAEELNAEVRVSTTYNTNDRSDEFVDKQQSGYTASVRPNLRLTGEPARGFTYSIGYRTAFRTSSGDRATDDPDHDVDLTASYQLSAKTSIAARYGINIASDLLRERASTFGVETPDVVDDVFRRQRSLFNTASLQFRHLFSSRFSAGANLVYSFVDSSDERRFDSNQSVVNANLTYLLSAKSTVGLGWSARFQEFEDTATQRGSESDFYSINATWSYQSTVPLYNPARSVS